MSPRPLESQPDAEKLPFVPYLVPDSPLPSPVALNLYPEVISIEMAQLHVHDDLIARIEGILQDALTEVSPGSRIDRLIPRYIAAALRGRVSAALETLNVRVDVVGDTLSLGHGPNDDEDSSLGIEPWPYRPKARKVPKAKPKKC